MNKLSIKLSVPAMALLMGLSVEASTIKEVVEYTMSNNPKVMSTLKNNEAYRLYIDEAKGGYHPKLDLTTYVGTKNTRQSENVGNTTRVGSDGYNVQLDLEQLIYDGGLTTGQIEEAQFRYSSNRYLNESIVDDIIYDSIDSYLNLIKYKNRLDISKDSLVIYNDYLVTAKETEEISGEALQKAQVNAKIHYANNNIYDDTNNSLRAASSFKKNVGMETDGKSCRPNLDSTAIPANLKVLIDEVLLRNPLILEQVENIKEQRAILSQKDASFYPTIKFRAQGIYDDDLIDENIKNKITSARIELTYNIFNGNQDKASSLREKVFLEESQKTLDTVTSDVIDLTTAAYNTYIYSQKRVKELEAYIVDNQNILSIYKDQFEGGTRTFIDVLNIERDLASARQDLVDVQYDLDSSYFDLTKNLGIIKESVLNSNNDTCTEVKAVEMKEVPKVEPTSEDVQAMLADEPAKEEMISGTYAVYFVAYKTLAKTEKAIEEMQNIIGSDYQIKAEAARGYQSAVVYNLETMAKAKEVRAEASKIYSDAYIRKIK